MRDSFNKLTEVTRVLSRDVLRQWASDVDSCNRFPSESLDAIASAGLLGYFVPKSLGGQEGSLSRFCELASIMAEQCLSTAMIWVMHCQQVTVLRNHSAEVHSDVLKNVITRNSLIASVTSEYGKGGDLLRVDAPLKDEGDQVRVDRQAPSVSYGKEAEFYLVTMRSSSDAPRDDVRLLVVPSDGNGRGEISVVGGWEALGMRGTRTVPMKFDVLLNRDSIIEEKFKRVALQTIIPTAHLGWSAAWIGAARGACRRFVKYSRRISARSSEKSQLATVLSRLAELRVSIDLCQALLEQVANESDMMWNNRTTHESYESASHNIRLNNLKIAGSNLAYSVVDRLVDLGGMRYGYMKHDDGLERIFRDLRSASIMFSNQRLLDANGKLLLVERASKGRIL